MFTFKPLWKQLIEKNMTRTELRLKINISPTTLATIGQNLYLYSILCFF